MKYRLFVLLPCVFAFVILTACEGKFVPDPIVPVLPKYSAEGYNAAGAMVNGSVWRAISKCGLGGCTNEMVFRNDNFNDGLEIRFDGQLLNDDGGSFRDFYFYVFLDSLHLLGDYGLLKGRKFDLGSQHYAKVYDYALGADCISSEGQIYFYEVIPEGDHHIIAGTFGFIIENDSCTRVEVLSGRFDYKF